jgi:hypothetical protein
MPANADHRSGDAGAAPSARDRRAAKAATAPSAEDRRARGATAVVFFVTGFVVAAWATRIPAVQERLGLSPASFALAVLGLEGGALAGLPAGGALVARLGSRPCLRVASPSTRPPCSASPWPRSWAGWWPPLP